MIKYYTNKERLEIVKIIKNSFKCKTCNKEDNKLFVTLRKQFISVDLNKGEEIISTIFSIIRTAINNGLDVTKYLEYVIKNISKININDLLPYAKQMKDKFS